LLARKVLENKTKGYKNHPQLNRFRNAKNPLAVINRYLLFVYLEAENRSYAFDKTKIKRSAFTSKRPVTSGQMEYEIKHLKKKLKTRDPKKLREISAAKNIKPHPLFRIKRGKTEEWEIKKVKV
jgi:hypothetical protein